MRPTPRTAEGDVAITPRTAESDVGLIPRTARVMRLTPRKAEGGELLPDLGSQGGRRPGANEARSVSHRGLLTAVTAGDTR